MASGSRARPAFLQPGANLSDYYKVEGIVRLSEGRLFYLVNDHRPDRPTRRCWECGHEDNPSGASTCAACGSPLAVRRFLVSGRWDRNLYDAYIAFFQKQITHPALLSPCDVFPFPDDGPQQLCSVVPFNNEGFLLDEAAPLTMPRVVRFAQRAVGMLAMLAVNGVRLGGLTRANFLIRPGGDVILFDPDVAEVRDGQLPAEETRKPLMDLGELLRRYTPLEERRWYEFFLSAEEGAFASAAEFGRALQKEAANAEAKPVTVHAGMTDVGLARMLNEDNWGWARLCDGVEFFVVADGMGGHDCGEIASRLAVETITRVAKEKVDVQPRPDLDQLENILDESFQEANNSIKRAAEERGNDMGTTLVAAMVIDDQVALCANVGDSRSYLIRGDTLHQITRDHSLVARMVEQHRLTPEEARNHPHANILLRTVGTERNVEIDIFRVELEPGDRLLLCSDGLWGEVEDREMEGILLQHRDNRSGARELVRAAHLGGGKDNITVILINVPRDGQVVATTAVAAAPASPGESPA